MAEIGAGSGTGYPDAVDTRQVFENVDSPIVDDLKRIDAQWANDVNAAVLAIEAELGVSPKGTAASVAARLAGIVVAVGGTTISGGTAANDDLTLQGTTNATRTTSYVLIQPNGGQATVGAVTLDTRATLNVAGTVWATANFLCRSGTLSFPAMTGYIGGYDGVLDRAFFFSGVTNDTGGVSSYKPMLFDSSQHSFNVGGSSALEVAAASCVGVATATFGTSAAKVFGIASGTAPTTAPADMVQMWSGDIGGVAGKASLLMMSESGTGVQTVVGMITKTDTGDPTQVHEGLMCINAFDNNVKLYAEGAWRQLATW